MSADKSLQAPLGKVAGRYADVLEEMLERWDRATNAWQDIRDEGKTDMRYVSGDPWDPKDRRAREDAGRPIISLDELGQYVNQIINDIRQNKRAINVTPIGNGANDQTALFRANLMRQIEYRSNAQQAYTAMFENAVQRSYGFCRIKSRYVSNPTTSGGTGSAFDQELIIESLPNPDLVTIDPDIMKPDGSDMTHAWISESWSLKDYRKKWPRAKVQDFDAGMAADAPSWMTPSRIRVAEYWTKEIAQRKLLLFKGIGANGASLEVFEDDIKGADESSPLKQLQTVTPDRERMVDAPKVTQYFTNGFEVLGEPTVWPAPSIPIACCFGKILYVDDGSGSKKKILSAVRLARDPAMLYCYYATCEAEQVGMSTKVPYFVRRGSLKADQALLIQKSIHEPVAFIEVEAGGPEWPAGYVPEMPQRNPFAADLSALEGAKEGARRAIQAAMGISPLPTNAQRKNDKSGVALKQIRDSEQQGSFHLVDAYENAITRVGVMVDELIPSHYDTARDVTVRTKADETQTVRVNDPNGQMAPGQAEPIQTDTGDHDITLSSGPSLNSEREAANDFADTLVQIPNMFPIIGPLAVKLKNLGPIGDEMVDLLTAVAPAPVQAVLNKGKAGAQQQDPAQLEAQLQQLQQQVQQMGQVIQTDQIKAQQQVQIEQMKQDGENQRALIEAKGKMDLEKMKIAADLLKTRATLEANRTEAMIDAEVAQLDAAVAQAGAQSGPSGCRE